MQYAGLLIRCRPEAMDETVGAVASLPGVTVHHREPATGRLVAVLEAPAEDDVEAVLPRLRALRGVLLAEPVYRFDDDTTREGGEGSST